jgi:hypothetical protein
MFLYTFVAAVSLPVVFGQAITPAPLAPRQTGSAGGLAACNSVASYISVCESINPGFDNFPGSQQASCLCYSSSAYMPNLFDNAIATCYSQAISVSDTSDTSQLASATGLCRSAGPVRSASVSLTSFIPKKTRATYGNATYQASGNSTVYTAKGPTAYSSATYKASGNSTIYTANGPTAIGSTRPSTTFSAGKPFFSSEAAAEVVSSRSSCPLLSDHC